MAIQNAECKTNFIGLLLNSLHVWLQSSSYIKCFFTTVHFTFFPWSSLQQCFWVTSANSSTLQLKLKLLDAAWAGGARYAVWCYIGMVTLTKLKQIYFVLHSAFRMERQLEMLDNNHHPIYCFFYIYAFYFLLLGIVYTKCIIYL